MRGIGLTITWVLLCAQCAFAQSAPPHACLSELPDTLQEIRRDTLSLEVCEDAFDGVIFALREPFLTGNRRFSLGGGAALMGARHKYWTAGKPNRLSIVLVPRTDTLWDVRFIDSADPGTIHETDGAFAYVAWAEQQRPGGFFASPLPFDDTSLRIFNCGAEAGGCFTHYSVPTCAGYQYPNVTQDPDLPLIAKPVLTVTTHSASAAEAMLANYASISLLARQVVNEIQDISCQNQKIE